MNENEPISDGVLEEIKKHFKFLFDREYVVYSASMGNKDFGVWEVVLKRQDFLVQLFAERGWLSLSFGAPSKGFVEIGSLTYFLSGERDFVDLSGDMKKNAILLQKYMGEFEACYGSDFPKYEEGLKSAEHRYSARQARQVSNQAEAVQRWIIWPVLAIIYGLLLIVCFKIYDELVLSWLLSEWLLNFGFSSSSLLMKGVSLLLAVGTVYITYRVIQKSDDAAENVAISTRQTTKRNTILGAIIFFPLFLIAFAFLIGAILSVVPWGDYYVMYPIITLGLSFLLALWIASSIYKSNRR